MTTVSIEIDGKQVEARGDAMLIEAAEEAGVHIPRFCYHKKLSIAANCRMCLVEVEKAAKPLPACATPVTAGMKVFTRSPKALRAQKNVMEFLLINHPLDCPICDQGGECELQDVALGYGKDVSRYSEGKRVVASKNIGPLIATDMTRCIHCTRCVRFGEEIAGIREMGATGRGEHMQIGLYVEATVDSEMSGNVIDLCPVGALTSKPFRYSARAWEMTQHVTVAPHDCIGSNLHVHVRRNELMRAVPRENEEINETWISDRDRFGYEGLYHDDRVKAPMIKVDGEWQVTDWNTALETAAVGLKRVLTQGGDTLGCLVSPSATTEEHYLAQKLLRGLGSNNIDHRLYHTDFEQQDNAPLYPGLGMSLQELSSADALLLIGGNIRKDQPIAAHRVRTAALQGAEVFCIDVADRGYAFPLAGSSVVESEKLVAELAAVAKAVLQIAACPAPEGFDALVRDVAPNDAHRRVAESLFKAKKAAIVVGLLGCHHPQASSILALSKIIAKAANGKQGVLTLGANTAGAWIAGAVPHRMAAGKTGSGAGMNARDMALKVLGAYLLLNVEPEFDGAYASELQSSLASAEFVVALSSFNSAALAKTANVILPVATFGETSGTFVNVEGRWQAFSGVVRPMADARPAWKVLRVLGNILDVAGFDYVSSEDVIGELKQQLQATGEKQGSMMCPSTLTCTSADFARTLVPGIYAVDGIVRRAASLQATKDGAGTVQSGVTGVPIAQGNNNKAAEQVEMA